MPPQTSEIAIDPLRRRERARVSMYTVPPPWKKGTTELKRLYVLKRPPSTSENARISVSRLVESKLLLI